MAIEVITAVIHLHPQVLSPPERLVLYVLAWHANSRSLRAWPAVQTIARETSLSRRAVQKILLRLRDKSFIVVNGRMARGSLNYALDLTALNRERYSQSETPDREPRSQSEDFSTAMNSEPRSPLCEPGSSPGGNDVRGGGEPRSPDPSENRHSEPSEKKYIGASAPNSSFLKPEDRQKLFAPDQPRHRRAHRANA